VPSNHISNEPYHEWLRDKVKRDNDKAKRETLAKQIKELNMESQVDVVEEVSQLREARNELAAMLAHVLGTKENLKKFLADWNKKKLTSQ
jgi:DNA-binding helix-hairpin-helix protein with protein kinase domain